MGIVSTLDGAFHRVAPDNEIENYYIFRTLTQ